MHDGLLYGTPDPILIQVAREYPAEALIPHVLAVRSNGGKGQAGEERLRAVANANCLVQITAEERDPVETAGFVTALGSRGEQDLAALALDVAAATRQPSELAALASQLDQVAKGPDASDYAITLLRDVVRRRLPRDVAAVIHVLSDAGETGLAEKLVTALVEARCVQDIVYVVLWIRTYQHEELADLISLAITTELHPADLAEFVVGLHAHEDLRSADQVIVLAFSKEVGRVADLVKHIFQKNKEYASYVIEMAVNRLAPADRLVLASLLEEGLPAETTSAIWAKIVPGLEDNTFAQSFGNFVRARPVGVDRALREATKAHCTERLAALVLQINAMEISSAVDVIFSAMVQYRSVYDIDQLAEHLRRLAYTELEWNLLDLAITQIHNRTDGGDSAELIHRLLTRIEEMERRRRLGRSEWRRRRQQISEIITNVACLRDPEHLMGMIDGLVRYGRYEEYADSVEHAVAAEYDATLLALLPQVRGYEYLPAVLDIICRSLSDASRIEPAEIPAVIQALGTAGAREDDLNRILEYTGYRRDLEHASIIDALKQAGLLRAADVVLLGHIKRLKQHRVRIPRFVAR